jgi:hypothetical protein
VKRRLILPALALLALAFAATAAVVLTPAFAPANARRAFDRSIRRELDGAQARLQQGVELFQDRSTWENPWVITTKHYEVRTTESYAFGNDLAGGLEQLFVEFQRVLGTDWEPTAPLKVFVFANIAAYNVFGDDHGQEHSSFYGSFFAPGHPEQPVATFYCGDYYRQHQWVTHSATHQFIAGAFPGRVIPDGLSESLASYFAIYWNFEGALQRFDALRSPDSSGDVRFIPLSNLLQTPITAYGDRPGDRLVELGVLTSYLLNFREDSRTTYDETGAETSAPFAEYVRTVLRGGNAEALPIHQLWNNDTAYLEDELREFEFGQ